MKGLWLLLYISILVESCFVYSGALDLQLWRSSAILYSTTSIANDNYTNIFSLPPQLLYPTSIRPYAGGEADNNNNNNNTTNAKSLITENGPKVVTHTRDSSTIQHVQERVGSEFRDSRSRYVMGNE